jgi:hypothetical protein
MGDPFAQMAATLAGTPPAPSPAEAAERRLSRAAAILRASRDADAVAVAVGLEAWLGSGGDLAARLGVKARRGRRRDLPAHDRRLRMRDELVRALADELREPGASERANLARLVTHLREPGVVKVFREVTGADTVPTSQTRLRAILRAP